MTKGMVAGGMVDQHNRRINYLRVSVTDRCNLRCIYCMPKDGVSLAGHSDILCYEEILSIIKVAVKTGISKVRITGGEPLVRKGIIDFVGQLRALSGIQEVSLTTNGILLKDCAVALAKTGISRINISLDSLKPERYAQITGGGNLAAVLSGIEAARKVGFNPIKINAVAIRGFNDDEVLDFANLASANDLQVRFIEFMPLGESKIGESKIGAFISNDEIHKRISERYKLNELNGDKKETDGPARLFAIEGGRGKIGFISPLSHNFCERCNRLRLTAVGSLRACLLSDEEVDLRKVLRSGCSADELEKIITDVIAHKPQAHLVTPSGTTWRKCQREMFQIGG